MTIAFCIVFCIIFIINSTVSIKYGYESYLSREKSKRCLNDINYPIESEINKQCLSYLYPDIEIMVQRNEKLKSLNIRK